MTLDEYIKQRVNKEDSLPFETPTSSYKANSSILSVGQQEKYIYFLVSGIVEVGRITNGKETIFDFKYPTRFISAFSSYHHNQRSDIYVSCVTDCVVQKISLKEFQHARKTSLVTNQLGMHILTLAYLAVVQKEKGVTTKNARQRYVDLVETHPEIIQDVSNIRIAKYLGIHPTSLSRIKKDVLIGIGK
jgi:CRP-like cAMP-binding protein